MNAPHHNRSSSGEPLHVRIARLQFDLEPWEDEAELVEVEVSASVVHLLGQIAQRSKLTVVHSTQKEG